MLSADGSPSRNPAEAMPQSAFRRSNPASSNVRVATSTMAIRLVNAANASAMKNSAMKKPPWGIERNSSGIQMKVMPVLPSEKTVSCTSCSENGCPSRTACSSEPSPRSWSGSVAARSISAGTAEKTVQKTMIPASRLMALLAAGRTKLLSAVSSRSRW